MVDNEKLLRSARRLVGRDREAADVLQVREAHLTAGPFETALQDVPGMAIFLSLATSLLHRLT